MRRFCSFSIVGWVCIGRGEYRLWQGQLEWLFVGCAKINYECLGIGLLFETNKGREDIVLVTCFLLCKFNERIKDQQLALRCISLSSVRHDHLSHHIALCCSLSGFVLPFTIFKMLAGWWCPIVIRGLETDVQKMRSFGCGERRKLVGFWMKKCKEEWSCVSDRELKVSSKRSFIKERSASAGYSMSTNRVRVWLW